MMDQMHPDPNGSVDRTPVDVGEGWENPVTREFSDVIVFRSPPWLVQRALFATIVPSALSRGWRGTYPQLSRIVPRSQSQRLESSAVYAEGYVR
jgi:hypothetical protein